jgi:hypothetical protein
LSEEGRIRIKQTSIPPALFEVLPPRNDDERLALQAQLNANQQDFTDIATTFRQFFGEEWVIEQSNLQHFRKLFNGFRFELEILEGFSSDFPVFDQFEVHPGRYLLLYENGIWRIEPLSPAQLALVEDSLKIDRTNVSVGQGVRIEAMLVNNSNADLINVQYIIRATQGELNIEIANTSIDLLSRDQLQVSAAWIPNRPGVWNLEILDEKGNPLSAGLSASVHTAVTHSLDLLSLDSFLPLAGLPVIFFLIGLGIVVTTLFVFIIRVANYE